MACEHGAIYRRAVSVHDVEIVCGMVFVFAAVACHGGRHTHAKHTAEDRLLGIVVERPVRHDGVFVHVDIQKAGADDPAFGVNDAVGLRGVLRHGNDASVLHQNVQLRVNPGGGVDECAVSDQCLDSVHQPFHVILHEKLPRSSREIKLKTCCVE